MSTEDKLNHLKKWMDIWIEWYWSGIVWRKIIIEFFNETGCMLFRNDEEQPEPDFEKHLQLIENERNKLAKL